MTLKLSMLFNGQTSNPRGRQLTYGFSETWYFDGSTTSALTAMNSLAEKRAIFLAKDTQIVGYRMGDVTGRSSVTVQTWNAPRGNDAGNTPVDAAFVQMTSNAAGNVVKKFWLHDLPDDWITGGALEPVRRNALLDYLRAVEANSFMIRYQIQTAPRAPVLSVDATGAVVTTANIGLAPGQMVSFLRTRDTSNRAIRGKYVVAAVTDAQHFTLAHWTGQVVGRSGNIRLVSYDYTVARFRNANVDSWLIKCGGRKVGRPFFQLRGRAVARR